MPPHRLAALIALLLLVPHRLHAQLGLIEGLFRNLDNVGGFWTYAGFLPHSKTMTGGSPGKPAKQSGLQGPGLAFTFHMGAAGRDVRRARSERVPSDTAPAWRFELAIAYSHITGFRSQNPSFDLRGSIRELPRLAWFAEYHPERRIAPYFGVHMGLVNLQSVAIYDSTGAYYPVSGSTWEVGGSIGAALNFKAGNEYFALFLEPGYTLRNVASLDWGGQNSKTIPARFPRNLRFTGWEVAAGVEFHIPRVPGK
jgi:hypothetical protein